MNLVFETFFVSVFKVGRVLKEVNEEYQSVILFLKLLLSLEMCVLMTGVMMWLLEDSFTFSFKDNCV